MTHDDYETGLEDLDSDDSNPSETMRESRKILRTRGIKTAIESLIDVAADKKAPAPARAAASTSLLRAAGAFASRFVDAADEGANMADMSAEELQRAAVLAAHRVMKLRAEAAQIETQVQPAAKVSKKRPAKPKGRNVFD